METLVKVCEVTEIATILSMAIFGIMAVFATGYTFMGCALSTLLIASTLKVLVKKLPNKKKGIFNF
jgi:hypothetical protein